MTHSEEQDCKIQDLSKPHSFFTMMPNIVGHLGLDPYEFSLYIQLKIITGENGVCFASNRTLCQRTGMSESKLKECKKSLCVPMDHLGGKSLITIVPRKREDGACTTDFITITDVWPENMELKNNLGGVATKRGGGSPQNGGGSPKTYKQDSPNNTTKKQPTNQEGVDVFLETKCEEKEKATSKSDVVDSRKKVDVFSCLEKIDIPDKDKLSISRILTEEQALYGIAYATHSLVKIKESLTATIVWAGKNRPDVPKDPMDTEKENRKHAEEINKIMKSSKAFLEFGNKYVEFGYPGICEVMHIDFADKNFLEQFNIALEKYGFKKPTP